MSKLIKTIERVIEEQDIQFVSFDVFDTLVFRKVAKPTSIFAEAFKDVSTTQSGGMSPGEYEELRHYAEIRCKQKSASSEVSLEQIIDSLPFDLTLRQSLLAAELAAEQRFGFIDKDLKALILQLVANNNLKVVFISDMYLSAQQIRDCFFSQEPELKDIPLFVSSEQGVSKSSGGLFKVVSKQANQAYDTWLHIGDNLVADIKNAGLFGIHTVHVGPEFDVKSIQNAESKLFSSQCHFNALRHITSTHQPENAQAGAFQLASFIWGPALLSFCDWIIDKAIARQVSKVLCLMREGEVFAPLIQKRLAQRNIGGFRVIKLYVSRKSTFWPSVDTTTKQWFADLIDIYIKRRGYSVANFYSDFMLEADDVLAEFNNVEFRTADSVYVGDCSLLSLLSERAESVKNAVKNRIDTEKRYLQQYVASVAGVSLSECITVDLGNGGTIQNHLELALNKRAAGNLLFYSTNRIYDRIATCYESFIGAHNDQYNLRRLLWRSPECIESFLLGNTGTTLFYDENAEPVLGLPTSQNEHVVESFYQGAEAFFEQFYRYGFNTINDSDVIVILARFLRLPTQKESKVYTGLYHQDNFGADQTYPVVSEQQIEEVKRLGIDSVIDRFYQHEQWQIGKLHWPQAICSLLDAHLLYRREGLVLNDNNQNIERLIAILEERRWPEFTVCGGGIFFEQFYQAASAQAFKVERIVDRKAEINGQYELCGHEVLSLKQALLSGSRRFAITSFAFKDEIAKNIYSLSVELGMAEKIEIISL